MITLKWIQEIILTFRSRAIYLLNFINKVHIIFYVLGYFSDTKLFRIAFNTAFIPENKYT